MPWSQRALTLYTVTRLRCCDWYIRCQWSLAVKPLNSQTVTYSQQVSVYWDGPGAVLDCGLWLACHRFVYNYTTVVGYASGFVSCVAASLSPTIMSSHNSASAFVACITLEGEWLSVSRYVRLYICPQKVFSNFCEIWCVDRGRWLLHDGMPYDPIQGQGYRTSEVAKIALFQVCYSTIYSGSWQVTTNS